MSIDKVKEFLSRVAQDPALKSKLEQSPTVEAFVAAAKTLGFDITAEDVARAKAGGGLPMLLSDADLDVVAGGASLTPEPPSGESTQSASCLSTGTVKCPNPVPPTGGPLPGPGPGSGPKPTDPIPPKKFF